MAVKSIIEIDVKDDKYKAFQALFDKYHKALGEQPGMWEEVGDATGKSASKFVEMTAALEAQAALLRARRLEEEAAERAADKRDKRMRDAEASRLSGLRKAAETTKNIANNVASTTMGLLKWVGIGGLLSGLVGFGGLQGLDSLAYAAGDLRKQSMGLGLRPSELQASRIAFGPYLDAQSNLESLSNAQNDVSKRWIFSSMGVNPDQNKLDLQEQMFERTRALLLRSNPAQMAQVAQARGLDQVYSMDDLRRMREMSKEELSQHAADLAAARKNLVLSDQTARSWQRMGVALDSAKASVENSLLRGLEPLAKKLPELSSAFARLVDSLVRNKSLDTLVDTLAEGIDKFAKAVDDGTFQKNVNDFIDAVGKLAQKTVDALVFLGVIPDPHVGANLAPPGSPPTNGNPFSPANLGRLNRSWEGVQEFFGHVPRSLLDRIEQQESGGRDVNGPMTRYGQAQGYFQLMPRVAASLGVNPHNEPQARAGETTLIQRYLREFHGDIRKALASLDWGPGAVERDVRQHGSDWERFAPKETRDYINKIQGQPTVRVQIRNTTGGSANATATALAYPSFGG